MGEILRALTGAGIVAGCVVLAGCAAPVPEVPAPTAEPTGEPRIDSVDEPAATLVLTGAEIGATASTAVDGQIDGTFEIFCDEGEYEVTVGTQLTCTYADDNGDTPAYIEVTAVEGSQYELSVSVP